MWSSFLRNGNLKFDNVKKPFCQKTARKIKVLQFAGKHPQTQILQTFVNDSLLAFQRTKFEVFTRPKSLENHFLRKLVNVRNGKMSKPSLLKPNFLSDIQMPGNIGPATSKNIQWKVQEAVIIFLHFIR